jgi:hypothetical protein
MAGHVQLFGAGVEQAAGPGQPRQVHGGGRVLERLVGG